MKFVYDDGGRKAAGFRGDTGDCVTRAIAIASGRPYSEVYAALSDGCRSERLKRGQRRKASARNGVHTQRQWFKDYMRSLGFVWTPTMLIGSGCKVHLADGELPTGRLVVNVSKHLCAVIDGVIHDTHDPSRRAGTIYPRGTPLDQMPKGVRWLENGNGWIYEPKRCVYGYWRRAEEV